MEAREQDREAPDKESVAADQALQREAGIPDADAPDENLKTVADRIGAMITDEGLVLVDEISVKIRADLWKDIHEYTEAGEIAASAEGPDQNPADFLRAQKAAALRITGTIDLLSEMYAACEIAQQAMPRTLDDFTALLMLSNRIASRRSARAVEARHMYHDWERQSSEVRLKCAEALEATGLSATQADKKASLDPSYIAFKAELETKRHMMDMAERQASDAVGYLQSLRLVGRVLLAEKEQEPDEYPKRTHVGTRIERAAKGDR